METTMSKADPAASMSRPLRLYAYLGDAASDAAVRRAAEDWAGSVEVRRGDVRTATRDLQKERSPDVLLVDIGGIELPVSALENLAAVCEPNVRVIAIGEANDIGLYRQLKQLGVAEYLFKPLKADLVAAAIMGEAAPAAAAPGRRGNLIAVFGARGGVGTTTLAVNLASYLADVERRRVALVDLDVHAGTAAFLLNLPPGRGLREALESPERVDEVFLSRALHAASERLDVLACEEPMSERVETRTDALLGLIEKLQRRYHYVVVDVPRALAPSGRAVIDRAGLRLLVCDGSLAAARDVVRLRAAFDGIGHKTLTVLNRKGAPGELAAADLRKALGGVPDHAVAWQPKPLAQAAALGRIAVQDCRAFRASVAGLAQAVTGRAATRPGLVRRLLGRRGAAA
ncbi:AAA family ATPase [Azospirillum sp. TSO22-1]|uniref:AAA family ATPase n=1 Tax=Azospirillum sp. TSO22-1 TaxID=716789 RepID=UPI000D65808A|nr:AAA family ATPase [Azospirillum sp. TSO22-1]